MANTRKLEAIRSLRRQRIADLLDVHGKVGLSKLTDISADYLWQMGKGVGKSARGVSDANAAKIEIKLGKPAGWMDSEGSETAAGRHSQPLRLDPEMLAETHRALRRAEEAEGRPFSLENESNAARFVLVYEMRAAMPPKLTEDELVEFGRKLAAIITPTGGDDGRGNGVPAHGTGAGKMARGLRRKG